MATWPDKRFLVWTAVFDREVPAQKVSNGVGASFFAALRCVRKTCTLYAVWGQGERPWITLPEHCIDELLPWNCKPDSALSDAA